MVKFYFDETILTSSLIDRVQNISREKFLSYVDF